MASRVVVARAPTRLDFGGGWTDVPPYDVEQGGCVCNLAIARYATVRPGGPAGPPSHPGEAALLDAALRRAGVRGVPASIVNDFPVGAGLGGSSAAGVAAAAAASVWTGEWERAGSAGVDRQELAERSRSTEVEELGVAGGRQDHYAAAFGGALGLHFGGERVRVERIALSTETRTALERQLVLVFTGESRISAVTVSAVLDAYRRRDPRTVDALAEMRRLALRMIDALGRGDVDALGTLLGEHWARQRTLHEALPTPRIEAIVRAAAGAGALGAKALGASGGGCVVVAAPAGGEAAVRAAVGALGEVLPFVVDERGVEVEEH
jgi:D-glycero-alpha-D-manno-heptose-7-phosphate kinase